MLVTTLALLLALPSIAGSAAMTSSIADVLTYSPAEDTPQLKLSGEFDYLLKEDIQLQLAALLTDKGTGEPISEAIVTFTVYDPDLNPLMVGQLIEEVPDSGVYVNTSELTMKDMGLPKGIYVVYAHAIVPSGSEAVDMVQFHVDPPSSMGVGFPISTGIGLVLITFGIVGVFFIRRRYSTRRISS